eukprot:SAG31_NODE_1269_length_9066_cov_7.882792_5_plen_221_part_00
MSSCESGSSQPTCRAVMDFLLYFGLTTYLFSRPSTGCKGTDAGSGSTGAVGPTELFLGTVRARLAVAAACNESFSGSWPPFSRSAADCCASSFATFAAASLDRDFRLWRVSGPLAVTLCTSSASAVLAVRCLAACGTKMTTRKQSGLEVRASEEDAMHAFERRRRQQQQVTFSIQRATPGWTNSQISMNFSSSCLSSKQRRQELVLVEPTGPKCFHLTTA